MLVGQYGHGLRIIESKSERIWELQVEQQHEREEWKKVLLSLSENIIKEEEEKLKNKNKNQKK